MKRVVVYKPIPQSLLAELQRRFEVITFDNITDSNRAAFAAAVRDAHGMLGANVLIDRALLEPARDMQAIATLSVGYDNFDLAYLTERGIVLSNAPDVLTEATADTIFALVLASARRVVELAGLVKAGQWRHSIGPDLYGVNVHGKTLGILGMGRIGQAVARRGRLGFGMNILYYSRSPVPAADTALAARRLSLDEVLAQADFVCAVLPLSAATNRLIGRREFRLMKPSAIFINGGRGATVDESALIEALRDGTIYGAGLDVFEREPLPVDSPLAQMNNVVALPHIGSATHETRDALARVAVENLVAALEGRPRNVVNSEVLGGNHGDHRSNRH